jgi:hypothetical protein
MLEKKRRDILFVTSSESHGLLVQTPNVSCGLHIQTPRFGRLLLNAMSAEL